MTKNFLKILFISVALLSGIHYSLNSLAIETNIPDLGQHSQSILSTQTEEIMGNAIMQKIYGSDLVINDTVVNEYLNQLALKFTMHSGIKDYNLHFFGLDIPQLNAFAFFGGHIAVHTGLFMAIENESELAAVLAHETAHIAQHHLARMIANNKQRMPITLAEVVAAVAVGALGSPEAGAHLATAAMAGHAQSMINFTREFEHEADRVGMSILSKSNFNPGAMASVFHRMKQNSIYYDHPPEYLLTHPVFDARIADAQNRAVSLTYQPAPDNLLFHLAKARIDANSHENSTRKVNRLKEKLISGKYANKTATEYAYALALVKSPKHKEGIELLKKMVAEHPDQWAIELGLAEAEQITGATEQALNRFKRLKDRYPNNYHLTLEYAFILLEQKKANEALVILRTKRKSHFNDPFIHQMLARTYSMLNQPAEVHRSQAEWHFARGEDKLATKQMELALENANNDSRLATVIKDRKAQMKHILARQKETGL